mgnify:CR=1 FL=1
MAKKRERLEVIRDILDVLQKNRNVKITHIIYKANLSNNSIKPYLENLLKNKMMERVTTDEQRFFRITEEGIHLV